MSLRRAFSILLLCFPYTSLAATYTVDRMDDSAAATGCVDATANDCSLRGAVIKANLDVTADTVVVPAGTYTLSIPRGGDGVEALNTSGNTQGSGDIDVNEDLIITGSGAGSTTIQQTALDDRIFQLHGDGTTTFSISGIKIIAGVATGSRGGGIWAFNVVAFTMTDCQIVDGVADDGGNLSFDNGSGSVLTIQGSTIANGQASVRGGGVFFETGSGIILNSTFSGNIATGDGTSGTGGGAINVTTSTGSGLKIVSSTFVGNSVTVAGSIGGALLNVATVTVKNSIFENNTVNSISQNCAVSGGGTSTSQGYNIIDDATCSFAQTGDQTNVATSIVDTTLADDGGETDTHSPVSGSVAIDAVPAASCLDASSAALTEDQRGFERPLTATGAATSCDAGAVEVGCGNQVVEASEACDEAGASTATCDSDCTAVTCGDGTLNTAAGEECEDSNTTAGDGCSATCTTEAGTTVTCGNSIIQATETCDDGNTTSGDGCSSECATETEGLTTDNPDVDFFALTIGEVVSLVAPSPGAVASISALGLAVAASEDTCDCAWSGAPTTIGTFSDAATCATDLTPAEAGDGSLSVVVDCGDSGSDTFTQSLTVASASAAAATTSSGGCSLQTGRVSRDSLGNFVAFVVSGVGLVWLRVRAQLAK